MPATSPWVKSSAPPGWNLTALWRPPPTGPAESTYALAAWAFLRLLGLIYFLAFTSLWLQSDGLVGRQGLTPIGPVLESLQQRLGVERWWQFPTLCWWDTSDDFFSLLCRLGMGCSLLLLLGVLPALNLVLLWVLYLSLVTVCQPWLGFQWDHLLLETGFLSIWLAPLTLRDQRRWAVSPPPLALWSLRWLLVRLLFASGVVKLSSGDATWHDLSALTYHYATQPLPTWIAWYVHQFPPSWHRLTALAMFGLELVVPWALLAPRRFRLTACGLLIGFQLLIMATGNYGFFNLLTILLCVLFCDDAVWPYAWRPKDEVVPLAARPRHWPGWFIVPLALAVFLVSLPLTISSFHSTMSWPTPVQQVLRHVAPLRTVNAYGLFAVMTTSRPEIILEGSNDMQTWVPYAFAWKPGDVYHRPRFVAPYMPRLDWQMWFAALGSAPQHPWLRQLMEGLLQGKPTVAGLLAHNPFPDTPPRYLRAMVYRYDFTDVATRRATGAWWRRERQGLYMPVMSLRRAPQTGPRG